jgi:hypothetical protein
MALSRCSTDSNGGFHACPTCRSYVFQMTLPRTSRRPDTFQSRGLKSQQSTTSHLCSGNTPPPANLHLLDIILLIGQISLHLLHSQALSKINADRVLPVSRVQDNDDVGAIFVQIRGAVQFIVADIDPIGVGADEAGVMRKRPCAFGDFVCAVLDFDELFVIVVVCGAVLDDEPPGGVFSESRMLLLSFRCGETYQK